MYKSTDKGLKNFLEQKKYLKIKLYKIKTQHIICYGKINDVTACFLLDTGASNSCFAMANKELYKVQTKGTGFEASGASEEKMKAILTHSCKFKLGRFKMKDRSFVILDLNHINSTLKSQGVKKIDGILGADFLIRTKAIIDYENLSLFLKA